MKGWPGNAALATIRTMTESDPVHELPAAGYRIREATLAEAPFVAALVNEAYRVEDFFVDGNRTSISEIRGAIERAVMLVAVDAGGEIRGTVEVETNGERGYFGMLSVSPATQGSGLGKRLVRAAEEYCRERGCQRLALSVVNLREALFPWYRKLGFAERGTAAFPDPGKLKRPCHLVLMEKALD